mmetsp:Transcript_28740/g.52364  ORF Transcript_28740/g.52364 Transcript_28740/m.52364 type:complete len:432 (+) Transcript_28740:80-1375(+)
MQYGPLRCGQRLARWLLIWLASARRCSEAMHIYKQGPPELRTGANSPAIYPLLEGWGLAPGATVATDLRTKEPAPDAAVVLVSAEQRAESLFIGQRLSGSFIPCTWRASLVSSMMTMTLDLKIDEPDEFSMFLIQGPNSTIHNFRASITVVNPDGENLPLQLIHWPTVTLLVAWCNAVSVICLLLAVFTSWKSRSKLHALMALTGCIKAVSLYYKYERLHRMSVTGQEDIWEEFYVKLLDEAALDFRLCLLYVIGLGWKVIRPYVRPSELMWALTLTLLSIVLQAMGLSCELFFACDHRLIDVWQIVRWSLHSLCYLVVVCAIHVNIFILQRQIMEALATTESGDLYKKHTVYCWFKWVFYLYIIEEPLTAAFAEHLAWYEKIWVMELFREMLDWFVLTSIMVLFCPAGLQPLRIFELAVVESSDSEDSME